MSSASRATNRSLLTPAKQHGRLASLIFFTYLPICLVPMLLLGGLVFWVVRVFVYQIAPAAQAARGDHAVWAGGAGGGVADRRPHAGGLLARQPATFRPAARAGCGPEEFPGGQPGAAPGARAQERLQGAS